MLPKYPSQHLAFCKWWNVILFFGQLFFFSFSLLLYSGSSNFGTPPDFLLYVPLIPLLIHPLASSVMQLDGENQCLKAAQDCGLYEKCGSLRSEYALACTKRVPGINRCNQHKCHRGLRRFLERVPEEYSLGLLFCPCTNTLCGERRRKTIVPSCSYQEMEGLQPNCLHQQSFCRRDDLCRLDLKPTPMYWADAETNT